ncbi:MAG: AAA family ATPase, partial [Planctomycetota bacterium]
EEAEAEEELLDPDFRDRARNLEGCLRKEIVGQEEALRAVTRAVRKASCGLNDPCRPLGSFLLVGRTGTGKTELAKAVARNLFGPDGLVRIDCSEYALPHETAKLIGAPPGYVGHNEGGTLTEALLRNSSTVILFDEVEKAHEKLHNMLLQILDEGRLTDSKGRTVLFRNAVVLLTSNVGTRDYREADNRIGFGRDEGLPAAEYERLTRNALERSFKPELLNRLDATLIFRPLDRQDCTRIASMQLEGLAARMQRAGIRLRWRPALAALLADMGTSEEYGAREIRRTVDREVEEPLSTRILEGELNKGDEVTVGCRGGRTTFQRKALSRRRRAG